MTKLTQRCELAAHWAIRGTEAPHWWEACQCGAEPALSWFRIVVEAVVKTAIHEIESPDSPLCDCDDEQRPTNPRTGEPVDHHCDCPAVQAAGAMLGDVRLTNHYAVQCQH